MTAQPSHAAQAPYHSPLPTAHPLHAVRAVAFDCYGTLIDFAEQHFIDVMGEVAQREQLGIDAKTLWDRWLAHSRDLWRERGRDPEHPTEGPEPVFGTYEELWTAQFDRAFLEHGRSGDARAAHDLLVARARVAPPYHEVREVLDALRGRFALCVLSNADDGWLRPCLANAKLDFEVVISSESARAYKPRAEIFLGTAETMDVRPDELLYVGDSPVADVLGARNAGLPVAWVNRYGAKLPENVPAPDLEMTDLRGLLALLEG